MVYTWHHFDCWNWDHAFYKFWSLVKYQNCEEYFNHLQKHHAVNRFFLSALIVGLLAMAFYVHDSDALRAVWSLDQMIQRSDVIVVGTVESTWIDIRPFEEYVVIDTAKIKVDQWLKNENDLDSLEIRYYGYWAKTIDDLRGRHISDMPVHSYESGQRVLLLVSHEEPTMVMGEGYYPSYEGGFTIVDDIAISQDSKEIELTKLYDAIKNHTSRIDTKH